MLGLALHRGRRRRRRRRRSLLRIIHARGAIPNEMGPTQEEEEEEEEEFT